MPDALIANKHISRNHETNINYMIFVTFAMAPAKKIFSLSPFSSSVAYHIEKYSGCAYKHTHTHTILYNMASSFEISRKDYFLKIEKKKKKKVGISCGTSEKKIEVTFSLESL